MICLSVTAIRFPKGKQKSRRISFEIRLGLFDFLVNISFFGEFFHVDSCESYVTLATSRGEKSGDESFYLFTSKRFQFDHFRTNDQIELDK